MKFRHKYRAVPTTVDGVRYDSKLESRYAQKLEMAKKSGELLFYLRQVPIALPGNTTYRVDFLEFWAPKEGEPGEVIFTDCKGMETETFRLKARQLKEIYPFDLNIVRKA